MDAEKLMQAVGYILKKYKYRLNYTKLIKLLYLADKEAFRESNQSISGDSYACMKSGPVLSGLYDLVKGKYPAALVQLAWNTRYSTDGYDLIANFDRLPEKKLSPFEKRVMDRTDASFHKKPYYYMINYVHNPRICPEWKEPGNTSTPLRVEDILKSVGRTDEEIDWVMAEEEAFGEEDKIFASLEG
jgi:hypothetical protein